MTSSPTEGFPKRITMYLHGDKESNWEQGEEIGLSDKAIADNFRYALCEVAFVVDVYEDGDTKIISVDGKELVQ